MTTRSTTRFAKRREIRICSCCAYCRHRYAAKSRRFLKARASRVARADTPRIIRLEIESYA